MPVTAVTMGLVPVGGQGAETLLRRAGAPPGGMRVALLNAFELSCDDRPVPLPLPAQRLLAFLALQDQPVRRTYLACTLWIDSSEGRAFGSLRSALWRLRQQGSGLVEATNGRLRLAPEVVVDVREAAASSRRLLDPTSDIVDVELDRLLLAGDLLPDWYEDWIVIERERFRQLRLHALETLCERLTVAGRFVEAVETGLAAVEGEPLRESAHRVLIKAHLAEGNAAEALRQYRFFRRLLRDRLGLEPSCEIEALIGSLMSR